MPGDVNKQDNINNADAQWLLEHLGVFYLSLY